LVPRPQPFLSGFQDVAAPVVMTAHEGAIEGLAGIARETQLISSDRVGQYLQRRDTSSGGASSTSDARSEASAPVCGASQPTPSTRVTYTQLLTEHNMDLDVPGLSQLGLVGDIFAGVEVVDDNPIHLETRSAEGSTGQRSTGSVDTPNIRAGTDTEGAAERSEGSGTRPSARRRLQ
ncbi:hypothetical protein KI387_002131, partial [Taxus chinensis]